MATILVDPDTPPSELRQALYQGNLVVLSRLTAVADFVQYTREQLGELFKPHDPERAHQHFGKDEMARMLSAWKPSFIHSDRAQTLVCRIIQEAGFVAEETHYDLPKPRTSFPVGHLTTGIAYAFPWHRDVWYSAPAQQINWWLPVFAVRPDNCMSFHLPSFDRDVANTSGEFDYYRNNAARRTTASQVNKETQVRPAAVDFRPEDDLVLLPPPGAILLFSGAQLHVSVPNTSGRSRYSVDFRTVDVADLLAGRARPSWTCIARVRPSGTSMAWLTLAPSTKGSCAGSSARLPLAPSSFLIRLRYSWPAVVSGLAAPAAALARPVRSPGSGFDSGQQQFGHDRQGRSRTVTRRHDSCGQWPGNSEFGVVIGDGDIFGRIVGAVDPVRDVGGGRQRLKSMGAAGRDVDGRLLLVTQVETFPTAVRRRSRPQVYHDVEHGSVGAAHQLGFSMASAQV